MLSKIMQQSGEVKKTPLLLQSNDSKYLKCCLTLSKGYYPKVATEPQRVIIDNHNSTFGS